MQILHTIKTVIPITVSARIVAALEYNRRTRIAALLPGVITTVMAILKLYPD